MKLAKKSPEGTIHPFRVKRNSADKGGPVKAAPVRSEPLENILVNGIHYSNNHDLPAPWVRAALNDSYSRGESHFSASQISGFQTPRAFALLEMFRDSPELVVDVSTRLASVIGKGAHKVAECAARPGLDLCEERFFASFAVDGVAYIVSAQVDLYETDTGILYDWKTTKSGAFSKKHGAGKKPDWIAQLNVACEILRRNNQAPTALKIIAMLKDWKSWEAGKAGHPASEVLSVDLPMWPREKTVAFIETQIRNRVAARTELPQCSAADCFSGFKCQSYCDAKTVCDQYKQMQRTGLVHGKES